MTTLAYRQRWCSAVKRLGFVSRVSLSLPLFFRCKLNQIHICGMCCFRHDDFGGSAEGLLRSQATRVRISCEPKFTLFVSFVVSWIKYIYTRGMCLFQHDEIGVSAEGVLRSQATRVRISCEPKLTLVKFIFRCKLNHVYCCVLETWPKCSSSFPWSGESCRWINVISNPTPVIRLPQGCSGAVRTG